MIEDIKRIGAEAPARIAAATSVEELRAVEADLLGKKGELTALKKDFSALTISPKAHLKHFRYLASTSKITVRRSQRDRIRKLS